MYMLYYKQINNKNAWYRSKNIHTYIMERYLIILYNSIVSSHHIILIIFFHYVR